MTQDAKPAIDAAAVGALLGAANAAIPPQRHAELVEAAAYVVDAGRRLATLGLDAIPPLTPCERLGDE
jgi:hypothetical protein